MLKVLALHFPAFPNHTELKMRELFQRIRRKRRRSSPETNPREELKRRFPDIPIETLETIHEVAAFTMTSPERLIALCDAVQFVSRQQIPGDIVECGVWKGGSMMAAAKTLSRMGDYTRQLWLYDTFDGMSQPGNVDVDFTGNDASRLLADQAREDSNSIWCRSPLDEVRQNLSTTGYRGNQIRFISGKVEDTIPCQLPDRISLLRLDTDWYESTKHELVHLYPRLETGGILIIDDYGHWQGCRRAVDEYFSEHQINMFLNRVDYTGRLGIKPESPQSRSNLLSRAA